MRGSPSGTRRPVIGLVAAGVAGEEEDGGARGGRRLKTGRQWVPWWLPTRARGRGGRSRGRRGRWTRRRRPGTAVAAMVARRRRRKRRPLSPDRQSGSEEEGIWRGQVGEGRRGEPEASPLSSPGEAGEVVGVDLAPIATRSRGTGRGGSDR